jgi:hypothetical protein
LYCKGFGVDIFNILSGYIQQVGLPPHSEAISTSQNLTSANKLNEVIRQCQIPEVYFVDFYGYKYLFFGRNGSSGLCCLVEIYFVDKVVIERLRYAQQAFHVNAFALKNIVDRSAVAVYPIGKFLDG